MSRRRVFFFPTCIDPLTRIDWEEIRKLIRDKRCFVLHAPRQTGKTSTLLAMMRVLNDEGRYQELRGRALCAACV